MFSPISKSKTPLVLMALLSLALTSSAVANALIGTVFTISDNSTWSETHSALAYNSNQEEYLAVWYNDSLEDEIWAQRLDKGGKKLGAPFVVSQVAGHARDYPDVAYNSQANEYLVVWGDIDSSTNWLTIQSRRISGAGAVLDPVDIVISNFGSNVLAYQPAVAYSSSSDRYMVVWVERTLSPSNVGIFARKITGEGYYDGSIFLVSQPAYNFFNPDIAYNRATDRHLVVWEEVATVTSMSDIRGCQVHGNGGLYSTVFDIESRSNNAIDPAVAAIGSAPGQASFLVLYDYEYSATDHDIYGVYVSDSSSTIASIAAATTSHYERYPAVAGSEATGEYRMAWREENGSKDNRIKTYPCDRTGNRMGATEAFNGVTAGLPSAAAGPLGDFLIAWTDQPLGQTDRGLFGALFGTRSYAPLIGR